MIISLTTTTLLLVTLATAEVPPGPPGVSSGSGADTPGGVNGAVHRTVQLPVGHSGGPVGPRNVLDESARGDGNVKPEQQRGPDGLGGSSSRRRGGHWHRPTGDEFRNTGPPTIFHKFPSCQGIDMDIRETYKEMWRHRQIGPMVNRCKVQNIHECMYKDMNAVRCNARTKPTEQCMQEVKAYVKGLNCGLEVTTTGGHTWNDTAV